MDTCPHCGAKLPPLVDAFCPDCFAALDEPTAKEKAAFGLKDAPGNTRHTITPVRLILVGAFALFVSFRTVIQGRWAEAMYTLGVAIAFFAFGVWWSARSPKAEPPPSQETRTSG